MDMLLQHKPLPKQSEIFYDVLSNDFSHAITSIEGIAVLLISFDITEEHALSSRGFTRLALSIHGRCLMRPRTS